jgi:hypothetical protein
MTQSRRRAIGPADTSHGVYPVAFLRLCNHRLYGHTSVIQSVAESIITHARNSASARLRCACNYKRIQKGY